MRKKIRFSFAKIIDPGHNWKRAEGKDFQPWQTNTVCYFRGDLYKLLFTFFLIIFIHRNNKTYRHYVG